MNLNLILSTAESAGISLSIDGATIVIEGAADQANELATMIKKWKPELIKVLNGETIDNVGQCDCGSALLGLPTFDGSVNRVCPDCGRWFRCLDPYYDWTDSELIELLNPGPFPPSSAASH